jgi:hypothetical protein
VRFRRDIYAISRLLARSFKLACIKRCNRDTLTSATVGTGDGGIAVGEGTLVGGKVALTKLVVGLDALALPLGAHPISSTMSSTAPVIALSEGSVGVLELRIILS